MCVCVGGNSSEWVVREDFLKKVTQSGGIKDKLVTNESQPRV